MAVVRSAWRSTVTVRLGAGNVSISWARTPMPVIENLGALQHSAAFLEVDRERLLFNDSTPTALEQADGNWDPPCGRSVGGVRATPPPSPRSRQRSTST